MLFLLTLASATLALAANPVARYPHDVTNINPVPTIDAAAAKADPSSVAIFAFYSSKDCSGTPRFQNLEDKICYGPLPRDLSFSIVDIDEGCEAWSRLHPCDTQGTQLSHRKDGGNCFGYVRDDFPDFDFSVQCNVTQPEPTSEAPPPPPEETQPPETSVETPPPETENPPPATTIVEVTVDQPEQTPPPEEQTPPEGQGNGQARGGEHVMGVEGAWGGENARGGEHAPPKLARRWFGKR